MSNSREYGSGRDVSNDEDRSISVSSVGSAGARKKKRFVTQKCNCGIYAILFMLSTQSNPNRLFFGCPYFKEQINDHNLRDWNPKQNHLLDAAISMEEKVTKLEDRVFGLELQMKNSRHVKCIRG
ncbi:hypothetical protein Ahy_A06g028888 isoform C [Arachis hypogaea]|uniref:Zinc finger GRF-type domain-containing protein n=1 Tax=Arachis hypogaea TaxID=3818 RepID=A0A445CRZ0_ARAHY|nr:hypothetical protein Ahy_A06g028888 isoform C [Arachis hypogaea]